MILGLLANLIHSVDAAIMWKLIVSIFEKSNKMCIINHVHDSIQVHPNYLETVYECIKGIYCNPSLTHMLDTHFLSILKSQLLPENCGEFDHLVIQFKKCDFPPIYVKRHEFDSEKLFPFEN